MSFNRKIILGLLVALSIFGSASAVCIADRIQLHLTAADAGAKSSALAKCFASFSLSLSTGCTLTMSSTVENVNNIFYKSSISAGGLLDEYADCPTIATKLTADNTATSLTDLLSKAVYETGEVATATAASGVLTVALEVGGATSVSLTFRPSARDGSGANGIFSTLATGMDACTATDECADAAATCAAGRYALQVGTGKFLCPFCAAGAWQDATGQSTCKTATAGKYITAVGASADGTACPAGTEAPNAGSSDCVPCQIGWFSTGGSTGCKACPVGWFSHVLGSATCVSCVNGRPQVCADPEGTSCTLGTTSSASMAVAVSTTLGDGSGWTLFGYPAVFGTCTTAATRLSFAVSEACAIDIQALGVSTVTTANNKQCSAPDNAVAVLTAHYVDLTTIKAVVDGAGGKKTIIKIANADATHASFLAAQASPVPNKDLTTVTGAFLVNGGKIANATADANTCPAGTYVEAGDTAGSNLSCAPCRAGEYCEAGATDATSVSCVAGTANPLIGTTDVNACVACTSGVSGTYAPNPGSTACIACAGTSSATACAGNCTDPQVWDADTQNCVCKAGYGWTGSACTACTGTYYSSGGMVACTNCTLVVSSDHSACTAATCGVGEIKPVGGSCVKCDAGQEPHTNGTVCVACPDGKYNPVDNGKAAFPKCAPIPAGMKTDDKIVVSDCGVGKYSYYKSDGTRYPTGNDCADCPVNTYNALTGQKRCISCPGGSYSIAGQTSCIKCAVGYYRVAFSAATECTACPVGTDTAGKTGAASCRACSPGEYAGVEGTAVCALCPTNQYSGTRAKSCSACPAGTDTQGESGAGECTKCAPGYAGTAGNDCAVCNAGYYQDKSGQSACKQCGIGRFNDEKGSDSCAPCDPGQYNPKKAATSCRSCAAGTYSKSGASSCTLCDAGTYAEAGSSKCTACRTGSWSKAGAEACTVCPAGYSCTATVQTACAAGTYQDAVGQTKCKPCPSRTYAAGTGNKKCLPCANPSTDKTTCNSRRLLMVDRFDHASA